MSILWHPFSFLQNYYKTFLKTKGSIDLSQIKNPIFDRVINLNMSLGAGILLKPDLH